MRSIVAALMILVSSSAFAQSDWVHLAGIADTKFYARAGSIHTVGQYKRMWVLQNYANSTPRGDRSAVGLVEFNCNTRQARTLQVTFYKNEMGIGIANGTIKPNNWEYTVPGTAMETQLEFACSN